MHLDPKTFVSLADAAFARVVADYGFNPAREENDDDWYCARTYRADARYIVVSANCHWKDGAPECRVVLGEGSDEWPETDWNAVALWRLRGTGGNYPLPAVDHLDRILAQMSSDLLEHAADFLSGDTRRLVRTRAEQNRDREPYKVYAPQADGTYESNPDPVSQELKQRFSK